MSKQYVHYNMQKKCVYIEGLLHLYTFELLGNIGLRDSKYESGLYVCKGKQKLT